MPSGIASPALTPHDRSVRSGQRGQPDVSDLRAVDEPPVVETVLPESPARQRLLLICDHASPLIPRAFGNLGLPADALARHIAWDIGAADVARNLSAQFGAPLVLSGYSRLVIDCNRALDDPTSIPVISDEVDIPGNFDVPAADAIRRAAEFFNPYHDAITRHLDQVTAEGHRPAVISVHSFTPVFGGYVRPWHVGVLWNRDGRLAEPFMDALAELETPEGVPLMVGDNEPYSARENFGYSVENHGQARELPHMLIEIRQDLIGTPRRARHWARIVGAAIEHALEAAGCL